MSIPLSLYLHIPWCVQKCPYCDFNSHKQKGIIPEQEYIQRVCEDLQSDRKYFAINRKLTSIFIGGGTPSLFSGRAITQLLENIEKQIPFSDTIEITLEANPGTLDERNFREYFSAGVNRLSIGVQSFNTEQLQKLGRIHNPNDAERAVKTAQDIGFDNINIDIMFGLPNQTEEQAIYDIKKGISLGTEHLSYYQLTLEPNTVFAAKPPTLPSDKSIDERFEICSKYLLQSGFNRYEVSAWTRGRESQHNRNYWEYGDYLGIGAGAHGKITIDTKDNNKQIIRTVKPRSPNHYLHKNSNILSIAPEFCSKRVVTEDEKAFEFMLNTMRLSGGFQRRFISERGLIDEQNIISILNSLKTKGLITIDEHHIRPTELGYRFVNDIIEAFL